MAWPESLFRHATHQRLTATHPALRAPPPRSWAPCLSRWRTAPTSTAKSTSQTAAWTGQRAPPAARACAASTSEGLPGSVPCVCVCLSVCVSVCMYVCVGVGALARARARSRVCCSARACVARARAQDLMPAANRSSRPPRDPRLRDLHALLTQRCDSEGGQGVEELVDLVGWCWGLGPVAWCLGLPFRHSV